MKAWFVTLLGSSILASTVVAQYGYINIANDQNSLVYNSFTRALVKRADSIGVALYIGPAGTTDENVLTLAPEPPALFSSVLSGRYSATNNPRSVPFSGTVAIQMRAFETTYGSTYEQALAAPAANGRRALVGKSAIASVSLANPPSPPPSTAVCGPFSVDIAGGGPYLTVTDLVVAEGSNGTAVANFKVSLASTQAQTVTVDFTTTDGSATAGSDYIATNGTVTFLPGEILKTVPVTLTADAPAEPDEEFYLDLSNITNAILTKNRATCVITEIRITGLSVDTAVSFNTVANRRYAVERTLDMVNWQPVAGATNVLGTGSIVTVVDHGNGCATSVLYRARLIQP